jgi:CRP/FNR family transcriptional regulator, cyclic AMP receptor protein
MANSSVALLLGKTALFGSLGEADLLAVAGSMRKAAFKSGQTIFTRGDAGSDIYLVVEGRVRLSVFSPDGRALSFKHANPGDVFGEIAVLDRGVRTADAIALTGVEVMTLAQARLNALIETNPRVARAAIAFLCLRLRETSEQVEGIALHSIGVRLARFLLSKLKQREADGIAAEAPLDLGMSQNELALLIGASRQKVNAALTHLEESGAVKRTGSRLVCYAAKLAQIATPA